MKKQIHLCFELRTDRTSEGKHALVVRLYGGGQRISRSTGLKVAENDWNPDRQRCRNNPAINKVINEINARFDNYRLTYPGSLNARKCMAILLEEEFSPGSRLVDFISKYVTDMQNVDSRKNNTKSRYKRVAFVFKKFMYQMNRTELLLSEVDLQLIQDWDRFLSLMKNEDGKSCLGQNTKAKYHSLLRTMLIEAYNHRLIERNPYQLYRIKTIPVFRPYLNKQQLDSLTHTEFEDLSLEKARLIFLFSCFTGIRFKDAQSLSRVQLAESIGEYQVISFVSQKTGRQQEIPVLGIAIQIVERIGVLFKSEIAITNRILPKISNQALNRQLKVLAVRLGIDFKLTHHIARHTFATTMLDLKVALPALQMMLGHSNYRETQKYAKISTGYLKSELEKAEGFSMKGGVI